MSCEGEDGGDREVLGEMDYFPKIDNQSIHGFPGYYYPYTNIPDYLSPLVAVQFLRPQRKYKTTIIYNS